jgi:hypothetical protein
MGRQAKGVRLVRLDKTQELNSIAAFEEGSDDDEPETPASGSDDGVDSEGEAAVVEAAAASEAPAKVEAPVAQPEAPEEDDDDDKNDSGEPEMEAAASSAEETLQAKDSVETADGNGSQQSLF